MENIYEEIYNKNKILIDIAIEKTKKLDNDLLHFIGNTYDVINYIKEFEEFYKIENLKNKLMENDFYKIKDNLFINQDIEFTWPDINKQDIIEIGRCLALKDQIAILVDGTVVPCCLDSEGSIALGNIFTQDLESIINSDRAKVIYNGFSGRKAVEDLCKKCGFINRVR